jgi:hypothetical protein
LTVALAGVAVTGCAGRQLVSADVPLQRVVLYRNGVGYFERSGQVDGDSLRFRVRREHVGDFLATLAVIDSRGHARSVSFPSLEPEEDSSGLIDVELELGGGDDHDLVVAYVVETPIWRPSYRVVMGEDGALLQGWAVVQNLSGEDWDDVRMSVTSGAPLSFRADLGRPVIPSRPMVTDSGEVVAAPVHAEVALADERREEGGEAPADEAFLDEDGEFYGDDMVPTPPMSMATGVPADEAARPQRRARRGPSGSAAGLAAPFGADRWSESEPDSSTIEPTPEVERSIDAPGLMRSVRSLAAGVVQEGVTRYDVSEPVTVRNSGSTMVAIINEQVPGEDALLYRPDPAVPDSSTYPLRVVRLENDTGVLLERGPVAIYQRGALLGQGLLDPLPDGATTSIPFAIERAVAVEVSNRSDQDTGRLVKIVGDRLTVEQFSQRRTTYSIRNGTDRSTKLYIRHERAVNWEVVDPPEGSEQVEGAVLLPVALTKGRNQELEVLERTPVRRVVDLMSDLGAQAVALYLEGPAVDAAVGPVLREALAFRERLTEIQTARSRLDQERQELRSAQDDVRNNLEAVRRIARASDLRDRLTRRLTELTTRLDELTNQIVELDADQSEVRVRMSEALRDLTLDLEEHEDE